MTTHTALITGCSSGFGKLTAKTFSQRGWNVIATMRSPEKETELRELPNVLVTKLDVTEPKSIASAIEQGLDQFGRIDVLVNNAGYGGHALFEQATETSIRNMFETNVFGTMNTMRAMLPLMRAQGGGTIINVTSMAALIPVPGNSVYTASKHATGGLTEAMALEYEPLGIRIRLVEPGAFPTTQFTANVDTTVTGNDSQLEVHEHRLRQHFAKQVEQVAASSDSVNDPQNVADKIYECATENTPIHNPVGSDAEMLVGMIAAAESRQAFIDQVTPLLMPSLA
ncbi:MAG: SDR family oxidoreductase [Cyanobacteria bacterium P01_F01_bin.53]